MTTRPKDKTAATPPNEGDESAAPDLVTSKDLFGDLVDAPPAPAPARAEPRGPAPNRKGPIKVQVSEPGAARNRSPLASPARGEKLPDDVAALLDAFSEPAESALRDESGPIAIDELEDESPVAEDDALEVTSPAAPEKPREEPPPAVTPADEDDDVLLDVLERTAPPRGGDADALHDLLELGKARPAPSSADEDDVALGKPASRMATKFTAAAPRKPAPNAGPALDLAALAEDAFATASASAAPPPTPAAPPPPEAAAATAESADETAGEADVAPAAAASPEAAAPGPATRASTREYGPYHLLERVAVGGMAEVFRAKRTGVEGFEKVVAVKRILSHLSDNKEFVDMFIDEAKMVAGLAHPNIVQIFDLGKLEKSYYIAMEYVHGRDLRTILRRAKERGLRIPLDIATYIVAKVCAALEYAHRKKDDKGQPMLIVHRDISPQNILISFEGDVKLTDFGIAKAASKASTTDKGALRGKLLYMSPEQAWGKPMDKRSDVFSLGIVFYAMLTEQKPFLGTSEMSILETVRECRVPPPTTINDKIPEKLERVVMKALERDPEVRYQDAGEMLRDLERVLHEWQPATASGLVRFLEILFDEHERGERMPCDGEGEHGAGPAEIEELQEAAAEPPPAEAPSPAPAKDPMSIQKLLKRFGIK